MNENGMPEGYGLAATIFRRMPSRLVAEILADNVRHKDFTPEQAQYMWFITKNDPEHFHLIREAIYEVSRPDATPPQCACGCGGTAGCRKLSMDDPAVKEVLADLGREITQRDIDVLIRSTERRDLRDVWLHRMRCEGGCTHGFYAVHGGPVPGETWEHWLAEIAPCLPLSPVLLLLADADVLGTSWSEEARKRVWEEKRWK